MLLNIKNASLLLDKLTVVEIYRKFTNEKLSSTICSNSLVAFWFCVGVRGEHGFQEFKVAIKVKAKYNRNDRERGANADWLLLVNCIDLDRMGLNFD